MAPNHIVYRVQGSALTVNQSSHELYSALRSYISGRLSDAERQSLEFKIQILPSCTEAERMLALVDCEGGSFQFLSALDEDPLDTWDDILNGEDITFDRHFHGLTQLYAPETPITSDIIAITGLDGHAYGSWVGKGRTHRMWLRHFLRKDLPSCRTMIYGYNSKLVGKHSQNTSQIADFGKELMDTLSGVRTTTEEKERPLIIIAHSFGGLITANCLNLAAASDGADDSMQSKLYRAIDAIIFFAVPHKGILCDDIRVMLGDGTGHPRHALLDEIEPRSAVLNYQNPNFLNIIRNRKIVTYYEAGQSRRLEKTIDGSFRRTGEYYTAVDSASATLQLPYPQEVTIKSDADHSHIVKFANDSMPRYTSVKRFLLEFTMEATTRVQSRFAPSFAQDEIVRLLEQRSVKSHEVPEHVLLPRYVRSFIVYDYKEHFKRIYQERFHTTCDWFIQDEDIRWWCSRDESAILWVSGPAGTGKSTLLTHLIASLRRRPHHLDTGQSSFVSYSLCDQKNRTASTIIAVAIHQLLEQIPEAKQAAYQYDRENFIGSDAKIESVKQRSPPSLWSLFCHLVASIRRDKTFIVIDALDECDSQTQVNLLRLFLTVIGESPCIKILVATQPPEGSGLAQSPEGFLPKFLRWSARAPANFRRLRLEDREDHINTDIDRYIEGEISRVGELKCFTPGEADQIAKRLKEERSGVFLPITLFFKEAEIGGTRSVAEILERIPNDLEERYETLFSQVPRPILKNQSSTLRYLMYSFTPLTIHELAVLSSTSREGLPIGKFQKHDTKVKIFEQEIRQLFTLLKIQKDKTVSFIHASVKKFLISRSYTQWNVDILSTPTDAHRQIAIDCLNLIMTNSNLKFPAPWLDTVEARKLTAAISEHVMLPYAIQYWGKHLQCAVSDSRDDVTEELKRLLRELILLWNSSSDGFRYTLALHCGFPVMSRQRSEEVTMIELLSGLGLTAFLEIFLGENSNEHDGHSPAIQYALLLAIRGGYESTMDLLIASFNIISLDEDKYQTILSDSVWSRRANMVQKVLRMRRPRLGELVKATTAAFDTGRREDLDEITKDGLVFQERSHFGRTAVHEVILQNFASRDISSGQVAAEVLFFKGHGIDINEPDVFGFTALHYVCWSRDLCTQSLVDALVTNGADPYACSQGGLTPLHLAARYATLPNVIESLLRITRHQISNAQSRGGNTPLHWAVGRRAHFQEDFDVCRILVISGADPYQRNRSGMSPIQKCASYEIASELDTQYRDSEGLDRLILGLGLPVQSISMLSFNANRRASPPTEHRAWHNISTEGPVPRVVEVEDTIHSDAENEHLIDVEQSTSDAENKGSVDVELSTNETDNGHSADVEQSTSDAEAIRPVYGEQPSDTNSSTQGRKTVKSTLWRKIVSKVRHGRHGHRG